MVFRREADARTVVQLDNVLEPLIQRETARAVIKIALNYWHHVGGGAAAHALYEAVEGRPRPLDLRFRHGGRAACHYQTVPRLAPAIGAIPCHRLLAVGNPSEGLAYVHVVLFDVYSHRVVVDFSYTGPAFGRSYSAIPYDGSSATFGEVPVPRIARRHVLHSQYWVDDASDTFTGYLREVMALYGQTMTELEERRTIWSHW